MPDSRDRLLKLTRERGLAFRLVHIRNVRWVLRHGLHCRTSEIVDPDFMPIGLFDLIERRSDWPVPGRLGGTLADYVPFYFTPRSPMAYNIHTGRNVKQCSSDDLVFMITSVPHLIGCELSFVFSDRHAKLETARFSSDPADLDRINWQQLREVDFQRRADDPEWIERYQAELLVHRHVPIEGLHGIACASESQRARLSSDVKQAGVTLSVAVRPEFYF